MVFSVKQWLLFLASLSNHIASKTAQRAWEGKDELQRTGTPLVLAKHPVGREKARREQEGLSAGLLCRAVFVSKEQMWPLTLCWHTCGLCRSTFHVSTPARGCAGIHTASQQHPTIPAQTQTGTLRKPWIKPAHLWRPFHLKQRQQRRG